jgi:hypothetical protein
MGFDPCNRLLKIQESIWDSNFRNGSSFGSVRVHALTLFCISESTRRDCRASFLARNLANLCFGCEPKVRVTTIASNNYIPTHIMRRKKKMKWETHPF